MKKILLLAASVLIFGSAAQAYEMAFTGGLQTTDVDIEATGQSTDSGTGLYVGVLGFMEMSSNGYLRSGASLSQRKYSITTTSGLKADVEMLSVDVPVTYMMMLNEMAGVYGGLKLGLNLSDDCSTNIPGYICKIDPESIHYALAIGSQFRFTPNIGMEIEANLGMSDIAKDTEWKSSIGVGVIYLF